MIIRPMLTVAKGRIFVPETGGGFVGNPVVFIVGDKAGPVGAAVGGVVCGVTTVVGLADGAKVADGVDTPKTASPLLRIVKFLVTATSFP